ncbi:cbb3-type cytochrome c oxidase subunit III [Flavobacteriaceae bacterium MAR_2010_72]|nr:cbb3-type cytochrome c oxidase subunit III [Flavobacteriaceae bacterium MAR_2010_72]TVZ59214.1 cbb3-type cytochrome c oxidase subunit III [Flavobacteriaceae bacterium MAR_2010_105]
MKKLTNRILIISCGFLISIIGISYFLYSFKEPKTLGCGTESPEFGCGTSLTDLTESAKMGKQIFNINCAACHMLNKNMTGPALAKTDSTLLWNWMTLNNLKIDSTKFSEMGIDYHKNLWGKTLNSTEINGLYEYINAE